MPDTLVLKDELKSYLGQKLVDVASAIFLGRAVDVIEKADPHREALLDAAQKVGKMVSLFLDKDLGNEIAGQLAAKIETAADALFAGQG
ncbi:MAG: hypothetical protein R3231_06230 [bacterium]|nr:hypothetical protein [bacterium]